MLKKLLIGLAVASPLFAISAQSHASDVGAFIGVTMSLEKPRDFGVTLQATSTRKQNRVIAAGGISYFPNSEKSKIGLPLGVGYQGVDIATVASYDFMRDSYELSLGYVKTRKDEPAKPVTTAAPASPVPPPNLPIPQ